MLKIKHIFFLERNLLIKNNKTDVNKYLFSIFKLGAFLGIFFLLTITLVFFLTPNLASHKITYLTCSIIISSLILLFQNTLAPKHPLLGLYFILELFILFSIYLSVVSFPDQRATALLAFFCLAPFIIVDNQIRAILFIAFNILLHTLFAYFLKEDSMFVYDLVNCCFFSFFSLAFASILINMQLRSFDLQRLLETERTIDILTGLKNRRKLYEDMAKIENNETPKPTAVFMLDIDHFKNFNDTYGHAAGDTCLSIFGKYLNQLADSFDFHAYRYGGEEFTLFVYEMDKQNIRLLSKKILSEIPSLNNGYTKITTSIGYVICNDDTVKNYEKWIEKADEALYHAKNNGRNQISIYS
ncbi:MAG: GGDEF domain-containing protein [Lachnospiraceae bacterium]